MKRTYLRRMCLALFIATLTFSILSAAPAVTHAQAVAKELLEDWYGTKFKISLELEGTWNLPESYDVLITITITDMGGNEYLLLERIEAGVGIYAKEELQVNRQLNFVGDAYSVTLPFKGDSAFKYLKPGETSTYAFYLSLSGKVKASYGELTGWTYESFDIDVRSPPSPISISTGPPTETIRIGDRFSLSISVTNDGEYTITDLKVEAMVLFGAPIVGEEAKTLGAIDPKRTVSTSFDLEAKYSGESTITVYVSYRTCTGYEFFGYENSKEVKIQIRKKVSSLTSSPSSEKISRGDRITISGSLSPAKKDFVYLTFTKPDGTSVEETLVTTLDGEYSYEFEPDVEGTWDVKARWLGDLEYENATSPTALFEVEKRGCIIATATYGSELAPEVQFLREFRDEVVLSTFAGRQFMAAFNAWYYSFSPKVAVFIGDKPHLREAMKLFLYPLIGILHLSTLAHTAFGLNCEFGIVMAGLVASSLIGAIYFSPITMLALWLTKRFRKPVLRTSHLRSTLRLMEGLWLASVALIIVGELAASPILMMAATVAFVISTATLCAIGVALGTKYFCDHLGKAKRRIRE